MNNNKSIKIVDLYELHRTEETKDLVQIFQSINDKTIQQSMVLEKKLLNDLIIQGKRLLNKERKMRNDNTK
jgi:hypothetical protein